ncbi:MAG TPA: class I SAM-dependent methyltransferase [Thermoleophilaceae bacterium]|nr:class I SAM-dependent methyltransferase [Thermoleophilaceae bacterium]
MAGNRIFAAIYDRLLAATEEAGLSDMRAELLGSASGRTLEIGAGTGLNLAHYPDAVTALVLTEPDPHMAKRLRSRLQASPPTVGSVEVVEAGAGELPFEDGSFDTVVGTLVLCTVRDPTRAVADIRRVLRPGGRFLYLEHVRDEAGTRRAGWQDRVERPWAWVAGGCHPNRDTGRLIASAFEVAEPQRGELPGSGIEYIVKPLIRGVAASGGSGAGR